MPSTGRKPRTITVRTAGNPTTSAVDAFARLLLGRCEARPKMVLVQGGIAAAHGVLTPHKRDKLPA